MVQPPRFCWRGVLPVWSASDKCLSLLDAYAEQVATHGGLCLASMHLLTLSDCWIRCILMYLATCIV